MKKGEGSERRDKNTGDRKKKAERRLKEEKKEGGKTWEGYSVWGAVRVGFRSGGGKKRRFAERQGKKVKRKDGKYVILGSYAWGVGGSTGGMRGSALGA